MRLQLRNICIFDDELDLSKYVTQLEVLSKLRNLQTLFIDKASKMPITYDLETDIRFLQGVEKKEMDAVKGLILQNILTDEQIALAIKVPVEVVKRVRKDTEGEETSDSPN